MRSLVTTKSELKGLLVRVYLANTVKQLLIHKAGAKRKQYNAVGLFFWPWLLVDDPGSVDPCPILTLAVRKN